jgi:Ca2+-binding RTX toxin-like protein
MAKIYGTNQSNTLLGGAEGDLIIGWNPANAPGNEGPATDADTLVGMTGHDTLRGGIGSDLLFGGEGEDKLFGGAGSDEMLDEAGNDLLYGGAGHDTLDVGDGQDRAYGGAGQDQFLDGLGNDRYFGGAGHDTIASALGRTWVYGGAGNDRLIAHAGFGKTLLDGGKGLDLLELHLTDRTLGVTINLGLAGQMHKIAGGLSFKGIERLEFMGTQGADTVTGGKYDDVLMGDGGNDRLNGGAGNDFLWGGSGSNRLLGGAGKDSLSCGPDAEGLLDGGAGFDQLQLNQSNTNAALVLDLSKPGKLQKLPSGVLVVNIEQGIITTGSGDDRLTGGRYGDVFYGGLGDDLLIGGRGNDTLSGDAGNDTLQGGAGDDEFWGFQGNDRLTGGAGADVFRFENVIGPENAPTISDFQHGIDQIQLGQGVVNTLNLGAVPAAAFVLGTAAQDASDRLIYDRATGRLWYDADGIEGATSVLIAQFTAGAQITASDFEIFGM